MGCDRDKNYPRIEEAKTAGKRGLEDKLAKKRCGAGSGDACCVRAAREKARSAIDMWF